LDVMMMTIEEFKSMLAEATMGKPNHAKCMVCDAVIKYASGTIDAETAYYEIHDLRVRFSNNAAARSQIRANRAFNLFGALRFEPTREKLAPLIEYWRETP